jgi:hypothetical protein
MRSRSAFLSSTILVGTLAGAPAFAADVFAPEAAPVAPSAAQLPAVSGLNGKLSLRGGLFDTDDADGEIYGVTGSVSLPVGHAFGVQADGMLGAVDGELFGGVGGHAFWRDPSRALVGVYGGWSTIDGSGADSYRFGVQSGIYLGRFSIEGMLGWEGMEFDDFDDEDNIFGLADIAFYPTDDLRVSAGYRRWDDKDIAALGAEYQLPANWGGTSAALFAEGRMGTDDYKAAWGGVRFYFGGEAKSLIRRHREDDPRERAEEDVAGVRGPADEDVCEGVIFEGECYLN